MQENRILLTAYRLRVPWLAAAVVVCGVVNTTTAVGEKPVAAESGTKGRVKKTANFSIALINLQYVFDRYEPFQKQKAELEIAAKLAGSAIRLRKKSVDKLSDDLKKQTPDSPEFRQLEQTLVKEKIELSCQFESKKREFARRELQAYHETYGEIQQVLKQYIAEKGIAVVLRLHDWDRTGLNCGPNLKFLNKPVVAYNADIDITKDVLRRMRQANKVRVTNKPSKAGVNK